MVNFLAMAIIKDAGIKTGMWSVCKFGPYWAICNYAFYCIENIDNFMIYYVRHQCTSLKDNTSLKVNVTFMFDLDLI